jgi:hypothetical protein
VWEHHFQFFTEELVMAKLKPTVLGWNRATAADVVGYRLRLAEAPAEPDYDATPFDLGDVDQVDVATLSGMSNIDGIYNAALSAMDDGGNESDLARLSDVPFDLVPPDAPTNFRIL